MELDEKRMSRFWLERAAKAEAAAASAKYPNIAEAYRQLATTHRLLADSCEKLAQSRLSLLEYDEDGN